MTIQRLFALLIASLLAACGGGDPEPEDDLDRAEAICRDHGGVRFLEREIRILPPNEQVLVFVTCFDNTEFFFEGRP